MKPQKNCSYCPLPPQANRRKDNGANDHFDDFAPIANFLLDSYASFTLRDAIILSRAADLPYSEVESLFNNWTKKLVRQGKIKAVNGAYDGAVFVVETV